MSGFSAPTVTSSVLKAQVQRLLLKAQVQRLLLKAQVQTTFGTLCIHNFLHYCILQYKKDLHFETVIIQQ